MATAARLPIQPYQGPSCPRCNARLTADWIRTGIVRCPDCGHDFESTAFTPPVRRPVIEQVEAAGPMEATACANHARNAAVTSCQRCGLLICALCDMNVGSGSYCPACFDRIRAEGSIPALAVRTRDYRAMARIAAIVGALPFFFLLSFLFGLVALIYHAKARQQMRARGENPWAPGMIVILLFAILELGGGFLIDLFFFIGLRGALSGGLFK